MALPEGAPYELIGGELVMMPSPFVRHQRISQKLGVLLSAYVEQGDLGEIFHAPLDVHFDEDNIVQPDLIFISRERSIIIHDDGWIMGVPDLLIEILSHTTSSRDTVEKRELYEHYGVPEFWIVDPGEKLLYLYAHHNGRYMLAQKADRTASITSFVIPGFSLSVSKIF